MADFNIEYYNQTDSYSDGDVEDEILDFVKKGLTFDDIDNEHKNYHFLYHLSDLRQNILNWYPFESGSRVLEIGSGCGAITAGLCRNAGEVVSVELSKRRASINYERNKQYENLHIYVGNLNDMTFEQPFDYVVLNGVFEYAVSFTKEKDPYVYFLKNALRFLKKTGKVLIAIENKFGLKYFAGAPEDHMGQYFSGVNGYSENDAVRTFTKGELKELLSKAGLSYNRFYYPYPDYKFPSEIFTDDSMRGFEYGRDYYNLNSPRFELFSESYVAEKLSGEGVADVFANSFLVEAAFTEPERKKELVYAKMNCDRKEQFRIITTIEKTDGGLCVEKSAVGKKAGTHIRKIHENSIKRMTQTEKMKNVPVRLENDRISYDYMTKQNLDSVIGALIEEEKLGEAEEILSKFFDTAFCGCEKEVYHTQEFSEVFGSTEMPDAAALCVKPANIDLICNNVFCGDDGAYEVIDCEWVFDFAVPVGFIKWRCINELYTQHPQLWKLESMPSFLEKFDIAPEAAKVYREWTLHFVKEYVGTRILEEYNIPKTHISLNDIEKQLRSRTHMEACLYLDTGSGYSEDVKLLAESDIDKDSFRLYFRTEAVLSDDEQRQIKAVRFDPAEGCICKIIVEKALCNGSEITLQAVGSELCEQEEGKRADIFLNGDPQYMWQPEKAGEPVTDFEICGKIIFYEETEAIEVFRTHIDKLYDTIHSQGGTIEECRRTVGEKDAQLEAGNQQLREREQQIERLGEEKSRIEENVRQLNSQNEELADTIVEKDRQIVQKDDMLSDRDKQLAAQNEKIDELSGQLYHITHTKGYLALEKARHIKDRMQFWKK